MKHAMALAVSFALLFGAVAAPVAQNTAAGSTSTKKKAVAKTAAPSVSTQLSEMKLAIDAQQRQIQQLTQQVQSRDAVIQQLQQQVGQVQTAASQAAQQAATAASQSAQQQQDVAAVRTDVTDLKQNVTNAALSLQETQKNMKSSHGESAGDPLQRDHNYSGRIPGGRNRVASACNSVPTLTPRSTRFRSDGAAQSHMGEFFGSGRQSRISMLAEGKLNTAKLTGYYESDFLGTGITSNNNESNSYVLRVRQAWAQAALNSGWSFTGGQMWSLVTETKKGVDNRTEALPMTIDPQYSVGFSWARQYGFRVAKNLSNKAWLAFSVENAEATLGGHGASNNFVLGQQGASAGLYNPTANYSFNPSPDFVGKLAFEPGWGHFEVFGVFTDFRDRIYPLGAATQAFGDRRF